MISPSACAWFVSLGLALSAYGGGCNRILSTRVADVNIEKPSALAALLQFGFENKICVALEAPGRFAHTTWPNSGIQTLLDGGAYQLSESNGVILIRSADAMAQMTQLDMVVPEYAITKLSVARANLGLLATLMRR